MRWKATQGLLSLSLSMGSNTKEDTWPVGSIVCLCQTPSDSWADAEPLGKKHRPGPPVDVKFPQQSNV